MTFRWGLLSTARINEKILAAAQASDQVEISAVASRTSERAEQYARAHGIPRAHGTYEALLADPEVDAVYVSLPNHLHVDWSIRALEAGKHVLCEKPLSRRPAEVERAFEVADRCGLVLSEAFMWRHNPQTRKVEEIVRSGVIGSLRSIKALFGFELPGASQRGLRANVARLLGRHQDIRLVRGYDGGALMDAGCYCLNAARLLAGEPQHVEGAQTLGSGGVDIRFSARLDFADGIEAEIDCGLAMVPRDELEILGSAGSLFLDDPFLCNDPTIEVRVGVDVQRVRLEAEDSYKLELENIADAVAGRAPLLLGRADAIGQARAIEALYRSAELGRPIDLITASGR